MSKLRSAKPSRAGATIYGIEAWKIALAAIGAVIFVMDAQTRASS